MKKHEFYKGLSTRSANGLLLNGFNTKEDVVAAIESGIFHARNIPGLGVKGLKEIMDWVGLDWEEKDGRVNSSELAMLNYINAIIDSNQGKFGAVTGVNVEINDSGRVSGVKITISK